MRKNIIFVFDVFEVYTICLNTLKYKLEFLNNKNSVYTFDSYLKIKNK